MTKYKPLILKHKEWICFVVFFIIVVLFRACFKDNRADKNVTPATADTVDGIDLLIPEGQTLVPIEIANYETLDSLLGPYGVVDLFYSDPLRPEVSRKIASMVKILRAPKNPSHFAVLVPARLAHQILQYKGPFVAALQNPKFQTGTQFEKKKQRRSRIIYE